MFQLLSFVRYSTKTSTISYLSPSWRSKCFHWQHQWHLLSLLPTAWWDAVTTFSTINPSLYNYTEQLSDECSGFVASDGRFGFFHHFDVLLNEWMCICFWSKQQLWKWCHYLNSLSRRRHALSHYLIIWRIHQIWFFNWKFDVLNEWNGFSCFTVQITLILKWISHEHQSLIEVNTYSSEKIYFEDSKTILEFFNLSNVFYVSLSMSFRFILRFCCYLDSKWSFGVLHCKYYEFSDCYFDVFFPLNSIERCKWNNLPLEVLRVMLE